MRLACLLALAAAVGACTAGALRLGAPEWSAQKGPIAAAMIDDGAASAPGDSVIAVPVAEARDSIAPGDSAIAAPVAEARDSIAPGDSVIAAPVAEAPDSVAPGDSVIAAPVAEAPDSVAPGDSAIAAPVAEAPDSIAPGDSVIVAPAVAEAPDSVAPAPAPGGAVVIAEPAGKMPTAPPPPARAQRHLKWGVGFHWGFDRTMRMPDGKDLMEPMGKGFDLRHFPGFELPDIPGLPDNPDFPDNLEITGITGDIADSSDLIINAPYIKMSRADWRGPAFNFGGKLFVDAVPFIETIELSFNVGVWQYDCVAEYLNVDSIKALMFPEGEEGTFHPLRSDSPLPYKEVPLTLKANDISYFGLTGTPYAKLQIDASARKTVFERRRVNFNAGAGVSVHFATPVLSSSLIYEVQKDRKIESNEGLVEEFIGNEDEIGEDIVQKILGEIFTPRLSAHIAAGARLKLPVIGFYVDGKYMIPISKYDENRQLKNSGFLVNAGVSLSF